MSYGGNSGGYGGGQGGGRGGGGGDGARSANETAKEMGKWYADLFDCLELTGNDTKSNAVKNTGRNKLGMTWIDEQEKSIQLLRHGMWYLVKKELSSDLLQDRVNAIYRI